ncbi:MAG: 6-bladed beta-propeller [Candidatus Aminicenantes bacterium]|nr:6-bladed beta-propeller [Candidatus Aminicenantes bacterium]
MKKLTCLLLILFFSSFCGPNKEKAKESQQNLALNLNEGEIVENYIEPHKIEGETTDFYLEPVSSIDFERDNIAELGLISAGYFGIDSSENVYFASSRNQRNCIYKFDREGNFVTSFGRKGQGPGEIQVVRRFGIDNEDRIIVQDHTNKKILFFKTDGSLIKETRFDKKFQAMYPLSNGNYIVYWDNRPEIKRDGDYYPEGFSLCNSNLEEIKILDIYKATPLPLKGVKGTNINPIFFWIISNGYIYIANEDREYEILQYDFDGNLLKRIRKEFIHNKVSKDYIEKTKKSFARANRKVWFPEHWPPFSSFFTDNEGRIFVKTYEKGADDSVFIFDIFNTEGKFVGRKNLNIYSEQFVYAKVIGDHLYCIQDKESGYKEFVNYKMIWR